jgi:hypothetical protein
MYEHVKYVSALTLGRHKNFTLGEKVDEGFRSGMYVLPVASRRKRRVESSNKG